MENNTFMRVAFHLNVSLVTKTFLSVPKDNQITADNSMSAVVL
jgi:hypothetical protein